MARPPGVGRIHLRGIVFPPRRPQVGVTTYGTSARLLGFKSKRSVAPWLTESVSTPTTADPSSPLFKPSKQLDSRVSRARDPFAPWLTESVGTPTTADPSFPFSNHQGSREFVEGQLQRLGDHRQRQCSLRDTKSSAIEDIRVCSRLSIYSRRCRLG